MSENMTQLLVRLAALTERAESADAELLAVREDNHSMMLEIHNLRIERDAMAAELAKLRAQEPVAVVAESGRLLFAAGGSHDQYMKNKTYRGPLYAAPVPAPASECLGVPDRNCQYLAKCGAPCNKCGKVHNAAPAVPDWNVNIERIRDVMHMLGISIDESVECFYAALPTNINRMTLAMKRHLQKLAGMTAITPTPFIPDADTLRNDAEFAAQQAATAPSVPEEWREFVRDIADNYDCDADAHNYGTVCRACAARALLQPPKPTGG